MRDDWLPKKYTRPALFGIAFAPFPAFSPTLFSASHFHNLAYTNRNFCNESSLMKKSTPVSEFLTTNCTIVEAAADIKTIRSVFDHFPNLHLPVVEGIRFVGVILREEFFQRYLIASDQPFFAKDLISKEIVSLSVNDPLSAAFEIFETKAFDVIPVIDEDGDLAGILLRDEVEHVSQMIENAAINSAKRWKFSTIFSF
jgi:CBS domain-containing protein